MSDVFVHIYKSECYLSLDPSVNVTECPHFDVLIHVDVLVTDFQTILQTNPNAPLLQVMSQVEMASLW